MYTAKRRGRSRCELFTEQIRAESTEQKELAADLERALANDELRLAYQPIISTHSGRIVGAEALLRWDHPTKGRLLPAQFLHLANETGAIVPDRRLGDRAGVQGHRRVARRRPRRPDVQRPRQRVAATAAARARSSSACVAIVRSMELNPQQLTLDFDETTLNDAESGNDARAPGAASLRRAARDRRLRHRRVVADRAAPVRRGRAEARRDRWPAASGSRATTTRSCARSSSSRTRSTCRSSPSGSPPPTSSIACGSSAATWSRATCSANPSKPTPSPTAPPAPPA